MTKQKKKRNKVYKGSIAERPTITRVAAVHRSRPHQWWVDHKRVVRPVLIGVGVVLVLALIVTELIRLLVR